jgi:LacI family transcriptional regulator
LSRLSGLSRATVRRALEPLQRAGWIERRVGVGTVVGPRAGLAAGAEDAATGSADARLRLVVVVYNVGRPADDWYTPLAMAGVDAEARERGVAIELLGNRERDIEAVSRRIGQAPPDALACLAAEPRNAFLLRDAMRLGVPCIAVGTPHLGLGVPVVCEDNRAAGRLAVEHLAAQGHRRIALLLQRHSEPWVFEREEGYDGAMRAAGLASEARVCWLRDAPRRAAAPATVGALREFLARERPSAALAASHLPADAIGQLVRAGELAVPRALSVVSFEQAAPEGRRPVDGLAPVRIDLRLGDLGRETVRAALAAARGERLPAVQRIAPRLQPGTTVRAAR